MIPRDTTPEAQAVQDAIHRRMTPDQRLAISLSLTAMAREGIRARIRWMFPQIDEQAVHRKLMEEFYGPLPF